MHEMCSIFDQNDTSFQTWFEKVFFFAAPPMPHALCLRFLCTRHCSTNTPNDGLAKTHIAFDQAVCWCPLVIAVILLCRQAVGWFSHPPSKNSFQLRKATVHLQSCHPSISSGKCASPFWTVFDMRGFSACSGLKLEEPHRTQVSQGRAPLPSRQRGTAAVV